ncbi:MAG: cupin protein [Chthonomonadales bacterium]|nr:cupin protein [Chthonomonadales bacterium]
MMPRVDWTLNFELQGEARAEALARAAETLAAWNLTMPPGEPLTLHFGLNDFYRIGEIEYWIVNDQENRYCGKFLFLFAEQRCPLHSHKIKDETFFIVRGTVAMEVDGQAMTLREGDVFKMVPGMQHTFAAQDGPALVLEVSLPSIPGDNFFQDTRIGNGGVL